MQIILSRKRYIMPLELGATLRTKLWQ